MKKRCQDLLDIAVGVHHEHVEQIGRDNVRRTREAFEAMFPEWDMECVKINGSGVLIGEGLRIHLLKSGDAFAYTNFLWSGPKEIVIRSITDLGYAIWLHREKMKERLKKIEERKRALDEWERRSWIYRLLHEKPR